MDDGTLARYVEERDGEEVAITATLEREGEDGTRAFSLSVAGPEKGPLRLQSFGERNDTVLREGAIVAMRDLAEEIESRGHDLFLGPIEFRAREEPDPLDSWCGVCGKGPLTHNGIRIHHGQIHGEGVEVDIRDAPPEEDDDAADEEEDGGDEPEADDDETHDCPDCGKSFDTLKEISGHRNTPQTDCTPVGASTESESTAAVDTDADASEDPARVDGGVVAFSDFSGSAGNGTQCQNCGAHLSPRFTRVFEPESEGAPRCCPNCSDLQRTTGGEIREARSGTAGKERRQDRSVVSETGESA